MTSYETTLYGRALLQGSAGPVIEYENGLPEDEIHYFYIGEYGHSKWQ